MMINDDHGDDQGESILVRGSIQHWTLLITHSMQYHARPNCSLTICSVLHAGLQAAHIAMILNLYPESLPTLVNWLEEE